MRLNSCFLKMFVLVAVLGTGFASAVYAKSLDDVIESDAKYIVDHVKKDSAVAIVNVSSESEKLSNYVMERFPDFIIGNNRSVSLVDRSKLELVEQEIDFQYSNEVDDSTMIAIGKKVGAQSIVSCAIMEAGTNYVITLKVIEVETTKVLGSQTLKIDFDDTMRSFFPHSGIAQRLKIVEDQKRLKKEKTAETVKNIFGVFSDGFYVGYLGSISTPIGISIGGINDGFSMFWDNQFGPPNFDGTTKSESHHFGHNNEFADKDLLLTYLNEQTFFRWDSVLGANMAIISPILWLSLGGGFEYKQEYRLFKDRTDNTNVWYGDDYPIQDRFKFLLSAGAFLKIHHFYGQLKYKYIVGEEISYSFRNIDLGIGYIWKK
ncbi:MAG: penicillin-binding protein activator LpoB [Spirochaetaceae bacterium]|jgi:hypothetical protein|nr:penicillin-binding protein activator LpoB [Spirochaetaceae bacterium]